MPAPPLVPDRLYGLRTWTVVGPAGGERLAGPHRDVAWPAGGAWLEAECPTGHAAPDGACDCGVHAWHPRRRSARRVLAPRQGIAGVVEAAGAIEVHADGFRAQRARPYALVRDGRRSPALVRRLAAAYGVPLVEASGPAALEAWCGAHGLGLDEAVVSGLLGPAAPPKRRARGAALRVAAWAALVALVLAVGVAVTDPPGDRVLHGRTGEVTPRR